MAMLNEVCELITDGSHFSPKDIGEGFPMLSVKDMGERDFSFSSCKHISKTDYDILVKNGCKPQKGDVLVAKDGSYFKYAFQICEDREIVILSSIAILRPKAEVLDAGYLREFLMADSTYSTVSLNYISGTALKRVILQGIKKIQIPLPPLEEQRRIAALLDKVSDLITKRRAQLDKLDLLVKARFVEMFGDPSVNTRWLTMKLSQLGELNRGVSKHRPRNDPRLLGGAYPLIQTGDVSNSGLYILSYSSTYSELGLEQSRLWKSGTLCITIAANIAQTSILTFDACFPDSVVGFVPNDNTNSVFIHYWFSFFQKILEEQAPQVAQKNINLKILSDLDVIVPPYTLQETFSVFVSHVQKSKLMIQQSLDKLETLKKAMMQQYFG